MGPFGVPPGPTKVGVIRKPKTCSNKLYVCQEIKIPNVLYYLSSTFVFVGENVAADMFLKMYTFA